MEAPEDRLELGVHPTEHDPPQPLGGQLGRRLWDRRAAVIEAASRHGVANVRVFGSVARGEDTATSDVDLLVDLPDTASLFTIARLQRDLEEILGAQVEIVPSSDLKAPVKANVERDLVAL